MSSSVSLQDRWLALAAVPPALGWPSMRANLGLAHRTIDAYARGLSEYLAFSGEAAVDPVSARREHIARFVRHLTERPSRHAGASPGSPSSACPRLSNATIQQRLTAVRLFYDHLVEEGLRTPALSAAAVTGLASAPAAAGKGWCRAKCGCRGSLMRRTGA